MTADHKRKLIVMSALVALGAPTIYLFHRAGKGLHLASPTETAAPSRDTDSGKLVHELAALEQQLQKKPGHTPVLFRMSEIAKELGKPAESARYLQQIVQAEPGNLEARLELGRSLFESGKVEQAAAETQKILATDPNHAQALYNLGAIHANINNVAKAREYWTRLVGAAPDSEHARNAKKGLEQLTSLPASPLPAGHPPVSTATAAAAVHTK